MDWSCVNTVVLFKRIRIHDSTMRLAFSPLSIASQRRYITPSIIGAHGVLSPLRQHSIESKNWRSNFTTPELRQGAIATITSNKTMVASVKQFLSNITSARGSLERDGLFHPPGYNRTISSYQAFNLEDEISKAEEIHKIRRRILHELIAHE